MKTLVNELGQIEDHIDLQPITKKILENLLEQIKNDCLDDSKPAVAKRQLKFILSIYFSKTQDCWVVKTEAGVKLAPYQNIKLGANVVQLALFT